MPGSAACEARVGMEGTAGMTLSKLMLAGGPDGGERCVELNGASGGGAAADETGWLRDEAVRMPVRDEADGCALYASMPAPRAVLPPAAVPAAATPPVMCGAAVRRNEGD